MTKSYVVKAGNALRKELIARELAPGGNDFALSFDPRLFDLYLLLVFKVSKNRGISDYDLQEAVHDAWAIARDHTRPTHPSIVPFKELTAEIQSYDAPFADAIRAAADQI